MAHQLEHQQQKKKDGQLVPHPPAVEWMSMLPDEILVKIGTAVAKLCGVREYVFLSQTSKRLKKLLLDSEDTISDIVRITTTRIADSPFFLLSCSALPEPIVVRTLEEVALYESCTRGQHNLLEENRVRFDFLGHVGDSTALVSAVRTILRKNPSASVVLDAHCTSIYRCPIPSLNHTIALGQEVFNNIVNGLEDDPIETHFSGRIHIRSWGKQIADAVSNSHYHPYAELARSEEAGIAWVEIFVRLETPFATRTTAIILPPYPDYYDGHTLAELPSPAAIWSRPQEYFPDEQGIGYFKLLGNGF